MRYVEYADAIQKVVDELDAAVLILIQDADKLLEEFWVDVKERNQFAPFAFNIQKQETTYRIRWGQLYKPKDSAAGINRKVQMKHINKGKGDRYFIHQLKGCPPWFEVLFHKYETPLSEIRKTIRSNRSIRSRLTKMMANYRK
ncbi:conjugative transfer protein MobI(A/C) [Cronobacter turicensis]